MITRLKYILVIFPFFLTPALFAKEIADEMAEEEERIVVIGCGRRMPPQPEMWKLNESNSFKQNITSSKHIFSLDHKKLYMLQKDSGKLLKTIDINPNNEDWVFDIAIRNKILVAFGFSAEQQANKIYRFRLAGNNLHYLDEYRIEFPANEFDGENGFKTPFIVNDKAVINYNSSDFVSFKVYKSKHGFPELIRDYYLKSQDNKNFTSITVFADVFKAQMDFRATFHNMGYSGSDTDGYRAYELVNFEDLEEFSSEMSNYNDYIAHLTNYQLTNDTPNLKSNRLLTFDFITERFKTRAFEQISDNEWSLDLSSVTVNKVSDNSFSIWGEEDKSYQLFLNPDWSVRAKIATETEPGYFGLQFKAFNKDYFFIDDNSVEADLPHQKLYFLTQNENALRSLELAHGVNYMQKVGKQLVLKGSNQDGSLSFSLLDGASHSHINTLVLDDYVDPSFDDSKLIKISTGKYVLATWVMSKNNADMSELPYEPKNEFGNGYDLLFIGISSGEMKLIHSENIDVSNNGHCINYCDEDSKYFWDNRRVLIDKKQLVLRKGSLVEIFEFDSNFRFTKKTTDLLNPDGLKSDDL